MLAIRKSSSWEYKTSESAGLSFGGGVAGGIEVGSSITFEHKKKGVAKFWYTSLGVGGGVGLRTGVLSKVGGSFALESFDSYGKIYILESFMGEDLETWDIEGYTVFLSVSSTLGYPGASAYAMLLGITNIENLLNEIHSDALQIGYTLGGGSQIVLNLMDRVGVFKNSAKAVLFMTGYSAGIGFGATALGSIGYVWQGSPKKGEDLIIKFHSTEDVREPTVKTSAKQGIPITLPGDALFDFDKAIIKHAATNTLLKAKSIIQSYPNRRIVITGHTDNIEKTLGYNKILSERRATAVKFWLLGAGVNVAKVITQGRGAIEPVASNHSSDGRAKNRRVEIVIMSD